MDLFILFYLSISLSIFEKTCYSLGLAWWIDLSNFSKIWVIILNRSIFGLRTLGVFLCEKEMEELGWMLKYRRVCV